MAKHRVAFIGCGKRARLHLVGVQADRRCETVALSSIHRESAEKMRSEVVPEANIYTDHLQMLREVKPDVVCISLWTPMHLPAIGDCARAGVKAVLCEKPIAPSWGETLDVSEIARQTGCRISICHQRRFSAGNRLVRQLIADGRFGKLLRMDLYSNKNLLDSATHTFDQALSFLEETPAQWVLAGIDSSKVVNWFNTPAEEQITGIIAFENGVRANLSAGAPDQSQDMQVGVRLHGTEGFLEVGWDGDVGNYAIYADPAWRFPSLPKQQESEQMIDAVRHVIDCLDSGQDSELSLRHATRAAEIIFAMYQSARLRRRITLPLALRDNAFHTMLANGEIMPTE